MLPHNHPDLVQVAFKVQSSGQRWKVHSGDLGTASSPDECGLPSVTALLAPAEAVREMEVSVSTLARKIRRREIEVRREGRRVYLRLEGPECVSDDELLRRSLAREAKLINRPCGGWMGEHLSWSGRGMRPGTPRPPAAGRMKVWRTCTRRSVQPTGGRADWPSGSA